MSATAARAGLMQCGACGLLNRPAPDAGHSHCARCAAPLNWRKPASIARTWAFLVAAAVLYIPANALPVIESGSLFGSKSDTILGGIIYFWDTGSWALAIIVFLASMVVPATKMLVLALLLVTAPGAVVGVAPETGVRRRSSPSHTRSTLSSRPTSSALSGLLNSGPCARSHPSATRVSS